MTDLASGVARDLARLLAADDAAGAAAHITKILWFLAEEKARASSACILVPDQKRSLTLVAAYKFKWERIDAISEELAPSEPWLFRGQPVVTPEHVFSPIVDRGVTGTVLAILYLEAPKTYDAATLAPYLDALGEALAMSRQIAFAEDRDGQVRPTGRAGMLQALDECEWNVARVARRLGITRLTVYRRMERYGIARQKMPKSVSRLRQTPRG